ncbi:MAG: hypothetical protein E6248_00400 [Clostridium sp.]|uniref:hypothetical protein n=1 Tax=Clostridium sp. TaxID=1506 RepID=UPI0029064E0B|nr:hypothetical protein [Clostridium sp.]MDU5108876.1 hypothetical protein [Clostridium sp.]
MGKINEINKYLTDNQSRAKSYLINNLVEKFNITKRSADTYYYNWKKEYMNTSKCVPTEEIKISMKDMDRNMKADINVKADAKKVAEEVARQLAKGIKKDHIAEVSKKVEDLEVLEEVVVKEVKLKGRNGVYQAKTGLGVALENGEYKLAFCNVEELTEFYNEYKKVFERI